MKTLNIQIQQKFNICIFVYYQKDREASDYRR